MAFKKDNKTSAITSSTKGNLTKTGSNPGKSAQFTINRESLVSQVLPPGGKGIMDEISQGLGIDILDPKGWTKEQVIAAKKLAAGLDEKLMMMRELMPAIMKFLEFQVGQAEFQAEVMSEAFKAKYKIDKAQAKAFVSYYAYMRKASQLEKRVQATQKHIDAAYSHFETIQDSRSNAILAGLNQQARLGENTIAHQAEMANQRREIRANNAERRRELREELRTGHLTSA